MLIKKQGIVRALLSAMMLAGLLMSGAGARAGVDNGLGTRGESAALPATQTNDDPREAHLLFIGDLMVGRHVGHLMRSGGSDAPFDAVRGFLSAPDLTIANLECPTVPADRFRIPPGNHTTLDLTADARHVPAIKRSGIDIVSLANNHAYDAGVRGLTATVEQLRANGLVPIGLDRNGAQEAYITDVRGIRIAFLAYADFLNIPGTGISYIRGNVEADRKRVVDDIARVRKHADIVAVFWHWGPEYAVQPSAGQRSLAQLTADAGADLVVGAHPHVAQGMETKVRGGRTSLVTYSLGNALFDQNFSLEVRQGLALDVRVDRRGVKSARLIPLETRIVGSGYKMNVVDNTAGQTAITRASKSTPDELEWRTMWSAEQVGSGLAIAYKRYEPPFDRQSVEDLGLGLDTRVGLRDNRLTVTRLEDVIPPTPARPFPTSTLSGGYRKEWRTLWQTEPDWRVTGYTVGDVNSDGARDLVYTLWKRQLTWSRPPEGGMQVNMEGGDTLPHIYVNTGKGGSVVPLWHGSPRPIPLLSVAVAPVAKDGRSVLAALESGDRATEKAPGTLKLWQWGGSFGFELAATVKGTYSQVWSDGRVLLFR
jgi:poly-gamma-glutamate capsule biosynthesis protein CapA/YwtB (metallophosphatase superfamily)